MSEKRKSGTRYAILDIGVDAAMERKAGCELSKWMVGWGSRDDWCFGKLEDTEIARLKVVVEGVNVGI